MRNISIPTIFFFLTTVILGFALLINNNKRADYPGYSSSTIMNRITHIQELALVKHNYTGVISSKNKIKFSIINIQQPKNNFLLKNIEYQKAGEDLIGEKIIFKIDSIK